MGTGEVWQRPRGSLNLAKPRNENWGTEKLQKVERNLTGTLGNILLQNKMIKECF
jgi:hypothetical protein